MPLQMFSGFLWKLYSKREIRTTMPPAATEGGKLDPPAGMGSRTSDWNGASFHKHFTLANDY